MASLRFNRIRNLTKALPYASLIIVLAVIAYFAWLNHNELESAITQQVKKQLLVTALSEAQSINARAASINDISLAGINESVKYINDLEKVFVFIVDHHARIVDYPYASYIGKDILAETKGRISGPSWLELNRIMGGMRNAEPGTAILDFFSEDQNPKITKTLMAFAPVDIGPSRYSIVVAMEYGIIADFVHKNAVDNLLFMGFMVLTLIIFGLIFYKIHREKDRLALTELTLNIINKQLHSEIAERKK